MKQNILIFYFLIFFLRIFSLEAHHTGMGGSEQSSTRFVDPFTGKREKPANYVVFTQDFFKQTNENSNIHTTTFFGEMNLKNGMFALNLSTPYTYYEQKNRSDAARIGKTYVGVKYLPLVDFQKTISLFSVRMSVFRPVQIRINLRGEIIIPAFPVLPWAIF
ncbi:hypothetical protein LEP1GSC062_1097 [Leptospira alexanderi serovar Manhao 3 str. L 60]|uniref:Uncharacterized protein n=1 Tax=Leptospira alexanderi serovar Manhao 3 str. L 60 TaxID=1049759 RepID=V6HZ59_9LEPT|nr:hypothetical protein LEP1GSC062_1097 [Leptospira alexanderi serovar Manhao 3 str. L 60]